MFLNINTKSLEIIGQNFGKPSVIDPKIYTQDKIDEKKSINELKATYIR